MACDFFTVDTLFLQPLYVLVFVEMGTRRVHFAGCMAHPDNAWITQQARQVMWELQDRAPAIRFLIRDNDKQFTESFDTVFRAEGIDIIRTPFRAPNANAYAERWIRSAREECLDKLLIFNQAHLRRVMREYLAFFNTARPHQGLDQQIPVPKMTHGNTDPVRCRAVWGGYRSRLLPRRHVREETGYCTNFLRLRAPIIPSLSRLRRIPILGGLHHDYQWTA